MDTIVAPLCGPISGSVQVLRISGPKTAEILEQIVDSPNDLILNPRKLLLKEIRRPKKRDEILDQALVVYFKGPSSYTGEDCAEIHLHASRVIEQEVLDLLLSLGIKYAEPGEFTKRAYLNGQMDLVQAEAVADLITAQTKEQARVAKQQLSGKLSSVLDSVAEPLRDFLAIIEAHIDFPEEGIEEDTFADWLKQIEPIEDELKKLVATYSKGRLTKEGAQVVLCGVPNVGKSSLLNALAREDRAIVTDIAGTTRDSIEQKINIDGYAISLWDTAGLENKRVVDEIEKQGIQRSWKKIEQADLLIFVFDLTQDLSSQLDLYNEIEAKKSCNTLVVVNKSDLESKVPDSIPKHLLLSAKENLNNLDKEIINSLGLNKNSDVVLLTNARHKQAVSTALENLINAKKLLEQNVESIDLLALEIRASLGALTELVGVTANEDILGRIFSKFCIGK